MWRPALAGLVAAGFSRTCEVRLKADATYLRWCAKGRQL